MRLHINPFIKLVRIIIEVSFMGRNVYRDAAYFAFS